MLAPTGRGTGPVGHAMLIVALRRRSAMLCAASTRYWPAIVRQPPCSTPWEPPPCHTWNALTGSSTSTVAAAPGAAATVGPLRCHVDLHDLPARPRAGVAEGHAHATAIDGYLLVLPRGVTVAVAERISRHDRRPIPGAVANEDAFVIAEHALGRGGAEHRRVGRLDRPGGRQPPTRLLHP